MENLWKSYSHGPVSGIEFTTDSGAIETFTGLLITFDNAHISRTKEVVAPVKHDVVVRYNNKDYEFTFERFLSLLGINDD